MSFASPLWFGLLAFIGLLVFRHKKLKRTSSIKVSSTSRLFVPVVTRFRVFQHFGFACRVLALTFLVVALARPQSSLLPSKNSSDGVDMVLVVDTSGSMRALDFELNGQRQDRLTVIKDVISKFIDARADDRIGMVVFGTEAFTQAPLTHDHKVLQAFLSKVAIGMAGDATAIGDGLVTATKRIKDIDAKSKVIILLTDGSNTAGKIEPDAAADAAASLGVKVYSIGVGSKGKAPMPVNGFFGQTVQYVDVDLDEVLLTRIAEKTGGKYFRAYDTDSLKAIYVTIDKLEKRKVELNDYRQHEDRFDTWVILAGWLVVAELLWSLTAFRRVPA